MSTTLVSTEYAIKPYKRRGVYWSAIIGGAIAATTLSLLLLMLGAGLGFASISPWYNMGASAKTLTVMIITWLVIMQWLSAGLGGYLTGRLRNRWHGFHADEGFFRDTVHGFLTWAIATLMVAAIVSSAGSKMMNASANIQNETNNGPAAYYVDKLYRTTGNVPAGQGNRDVNAETSRILMRNLGEGGIPDQDKSYLAGLVTARTGLSPADAHARVDNILVQEKMDADEARKVAERLSLFTFIAMLIGAFVASVAAALGGLHRDSYDQHI